MKKLFFVICILLWLGVFPVRPDDISNGFTNYFHIYRIETRFELEKSRSGEYNDKTFSIY